MERFSYTCLSRWGNEEEKFMQNVFGFYIGRILKMISVLMKPPWSWKNLHRIVEQGQRSVKTVKDFLPFSPNLTSSFWTCGCCAVKSKQTNHEKRKQSNCWLVLQCNAIAMLWGQGYCPLMRQHAGDYQHKSIMAHFKPKQSPAKFEFNPFCRAAASQWIGMLHWNVQKMLNGDSSWSICVLPFHGQRIGGESLMVGWELTFRNLVRILK